MAAVNKYRNIPVLVDGHRFSSKREAKRYGELKLLRAAGEIYGLLVQPRYPIVVNNEKICTYVGDFFYTDRKTETFVVEDVKGVRTPVYKLKKKLMKAVHGIDIVEI